MDPTETFLDSLFSTARVVDRRHFLATGAGLMPPASADDASAAISEQDRDHMRQAIGLMRQAGIIEKSGAPGGCVIVQNGEILAAEANSVLRDNDPSAHAEINAIRAACRKIGVPHLKGAVLYASGEPCPMCYAAAYWARVAKIYYAAAWADCADLFDDQNLGQEMKKPYAERKLTAEPLLRTEAQKVWAEFRKLPDRTRY